MIRLAAFILAALWLPMILSATPAETPPPLEPIYLDVPPFVDSVNFNNPQMIRDRAGVIWAATRGSSNIGGIVWRVDGYQDKDHRGTPTQVFPSDPRQFFALGELIVFPDHYLYYITVEVDNPDASQRHAIAQVAWPVPGFTP